ncbi:neurobeachin protein, partial [Trichinella spiralis]|uniref:neurobeachin protein n=1 Tax=Trichinella spiralis TaxID=6334 RepID=UPI0001EFE9B6
KLENTKLGEVSSIKHALQLEPLSFSHADKSVAHLHKFEAFPRLVYHGTTYEEAFLRTIHI